MTIGSFLLLTIFPALLPPSRYESDDDEFEYYTVLGLNIVDKDSIDIAAIRKAYRKKSLQLHPDKIAQRRHGGGGGGSTDNNGDNGVDDDIIKLKKQYEHVQEAYNCLQNDSSRAVYHTYGCSVRRYRFVTGPQPELYNPLSCGENLAKSSVVLKTRIVAAVAIIIIISFIQPILIATKINGTRLQTTSWMILLIPWWIFHSVLLLFFTSLLVISKCKDIHIFSAFIECIVWLIGIIRLVQVWDINSNNNSTTSTNWNEIATPFLVAIVIRICSCVLMIRTIRHTQKKMVTLSYLEKKECTQAAMRQWQNDHPTTTTNTDNNDNNDDTVPTPSYVDETTTAISLEDLPEERQKEIMSKYVVVTVDDEIAVHAQVLAQQAKAAADIERSTDPTTTNNNTINDQFDEDEFTNIFCVQTSDEYRYAEQQKQILYRKISTYLLCHLIFIILVLKKLTPTSKLYNSSWWIIFIPVLLSIGIPLLTNFCICCCASTLTKDPHDTLDDDDDNNDASENNDNNNKNTRTDIPTPLDGDIEEGKTKPSTTTTTTTTTAPTTTTTTGTGNTNNDDDDDDDDNNTNAIVTTIEEEINNCATMKISELRNELTEIYNIDCTTFVEKSEFVQALANARVSKTNQKRKTTTSLLSSLNPNTDDTNNTDSVTAFVPIESTTTNNSATTRTTTGPVPASNPETFADEAGNGGNDADADDDNDNSSANNDEYMQALMKSKANACFGCCWYLFQCILLCLIIGKLEAMYDDDDDNNNNNDNNDGGSNGYSAFWILFIPFLIAGIILCCCSCLIYGFNSDELNEIKGGNGNNTNTGAGTDGTSGGDDNNDVPPTSNENVVIPAPPTETTVPPTLPVVDENLPTIPSKDDMLPSATVSNVNVAPTLSENENDKPNDWPTKDSGSGVDVEMADTTNIHDID